MHALTRLRRAAKAVLGQGVTAPAPLRVEAGAPQADGFACVIDRYAIAQGTVRVAGWVVLPGAALRSIELRMPGGARHAVRRLRLPSPDVAALHGAMGARARFDDSLQVAASPDEIVRAELVVQAEGQPARILGNLGAVGPGDPAHALRGRFAAMLGERPVGHLLEIGSRARSGNINRDVLPEGWRYTGLDVLPGENVDVVGDAHEASSLLPLATYDAVMGISVFEHLLMPWKFAIELNRVLRPGAIGFFMTHQAWPMHDRPWDFWRFSDTAWSGLFNAATGFEVVGTGLGEPAFLVAEKCHPATNFGEQPCYGASAVLVRKTGETSLAWPVALPDVMSTCYPT